MTIDPEGKTALSVVKRPILHTRTAPSTRTQYLINEDLSEKIETEKTNNDVERCARVHVRVMYRVVRFEISFVSLRI